MRQILQGLQDDFMIQVTMKSKVPFQPVLQRVLQWIWQTRAHPASELIQDSAHPEHKAQAHMPCAGRQALGCVEGA